MMMRRDAQTASGMGNILTFGSGASGPGYPKRLLLVPQVPVCRYSVLSVTHPKVDKFDTLY